jgi:hypothetical protein
MNAEQREARWLRAYEAQKKIFEEKKKKKEYYLMERQSQIELKLAELQSQRETIEKAIKEVAEEQFISFDTFREKAIRSSEASKASDTKTT